jgi:aspartate racemase
MKTLGIVGGTGPESTIEYYRLIVAGYRQQRPDGSYPPILITSLDMTRLLRDIGEDDLEAAAQYLTAEVERLRRAGADLAIIAANTPHVVFPEVAARSAVPMISIVETTCATARERGMRRVGLLGPRFVVEGDFYPKVLRTAGIEVVLPQRADAIRLHELYMGELMRGIVQPASREVVRAIVDDLVGRGADGVILGGTELSLLFSDDSIAGVPVLDTTRLHAAAAVTAMLS